MSDTLYKIIYRDAETGKPLTIHANNIEDSPLGFGFVKVSGFVFDGPAASSPLIIPGQENIEQDFEDVQAEHLNIHLILKVREMKGSELQLSEDRPKVVLLQQPEGE